jgi:hypothetical protein
VTEKREDSDGLTGSLTIQATLRDLAIRYATAADRGDADGFANVFFGDATVTVLRDGKSQAISGHDELRSIPGLLRRYDRTFHQLGQSSYRIRQSDATGEVYCIANHLFRDVNTVMYIRYQDEYGQNPTGGWRIRSRLVVVDWTEDHRTSSFGPPQG